MTEFLRSGTVLLGEAAEKGGGHEGPSFLGLFIYFGFVLVILFAMMNFAKRGLNTRFFTNRVTQLFEQLYLFVEKMCVDIIGSHGRKYVPFIMTLWMVIFVSNVVALFFPTAPTADLAFNVGMALISVAYVQFEGMRTNGVFGHFRHFAGPTLPIALIGINIMIFVIELISEMMKNVSLSLRLFGNIHGGHMAVEKMNDVGAAISIPFGQFLLPIKVLTCIVQALIFTLLTCVYISLVTAHHDDHEEEHSHGHGAPVAA